MIIMSLSYLFFEIFAIFVTIRLRKILTKNNHAVILTFSIILLFRFVIYIAGYIFLKDKKIREDNKNYGEMS